MRLKLTLTKQKHKDAGYISCIKLPWWQPIVFYLLQLIMAIWLFIILIMPVYGLKLMILDSHFMEPNKTLKKYIIEDETDRSLDKGNK